MKKGYGSLRDTSGGVPRHCCLGVAIEITDPSLFTRLTEDSDIDYVVVKNAHCGNELPAWLGQFLDLSSLDMGTLTMLNDRTQLSFDKIGALLESWQSAGGIKRYDFKRWYEIYGVDALRPSTVGWSV